MGLGTGVAKGCFRPGKRRPGHFPYSCPGSAVSQASQRTENVIEADRAREGIKYTQRTIRSRVSGKTWGPSQYGGRQGDLRLMTTGGDYIVSLVWILALYLPLCPHQNSVSSHERRGATKKRKAPQPPASTPIPVRVAGSLGQGGVLLVLETLPKVVLPGGEGTGRSGCL